MGSAWHNRCLWSPLDWNQLDGKCGAEPLERSQRIAGRKGFEPHDAVIAEPVECGCDSGVVDLTGARFAPAGDVRDLDLADEWQRPLDQFDQVPFADLRVVEVQIHSQVWIVNRFDQ